MTTRCTITLRTLLLVLAALLPLASAQAQSTFIGKELLGRITNKSVTVNIAADRDLEVYFEYGTQPGVYASRTAPVTYPGGTPFNTLLDNLQANTRYYYRMRYREPNAATFEARAEHSFQTARPRGSTFSFAIQFDPHMDENSSADVYNLTLQNELAAAPDFLIDLGDTFMSDKLQPITQPAIHDRVRLMRSFYDVVGHSVPLLLSLGNHEGEWGRNLNGTANNVAVWNTDLRKQYIPNPQADGFYLSDQTVEPLVGVRESYYAWEWGDALFVVLDPYWHRTVAPDQAGDWSLTLGRNQYAWLKRTLETSTAKFKFVFAHNLIGGKDLDGPMRGGVETAKYLEWGGYNLDNTWGFDRARPGWPMPIHQLLVANHVTAFFHGHDHLYAKQDLDGVIYQEGPQPSARNFNLGTRATDYQYTHGTVLGGTGYIRVTVSPNEVKSEYVQTWLPSQENATRRNAMVADTWTATARASDLKVVSAASYLGGAVAPASLVSAFGSSLPNRPAAIRDSTGTERLAELLAASAGQVNLQIPAATALGAARLTSGSAAGDVSVLNVMPGLFAANATGQGPAAAMVVHVKADGTQTSEPTFRCGSTPGSCTTSPIDLGPATEQVFLSLYGTGVRNVSTLSDVIVTVGGERAEVFYAGAQPSFTGLDQINVRIPRTLLGRGEIPVVVTAEGKVSNPVAINIQ